MTHLETLLRDAAEAEAVSFDHGDIRRRAARRRRVQMVMACVVVVVGAAGVTLTDRGDGDVRVASESTMVGELTVDELTADRWVPHAYSTVTTGEGGPYVEFGDDGSFVGVFPCEIVTARWSALDGVLAFDDIDVPSPPGFDPDECEAEGEVGFVDLMRSGPVVERAVGRDSMSLRVGDEFISFRRFDRLGSVPTPASLEGTWRHGSDGTVTFHGPSAATVSIDLPGREPCVAPTGWRLDGDNLVFDADLGNGIDCGGGSAVGGGIAFVLDESPRVRIEDTGTGFLLWLAGDGGAPFLTKEEPHGPASEPDHRPDHRSAKDLAEQAMQEVFGVSAVTMAVEDDGLSTVTMEVDGEEVVARIGQSTGGNVVVDIASSPAPGVIEDDGRFRVAVPEPGVLTVKGLDGEDEPDASKPHLFFAPRHVDAGLTDPFPFPESNWLAVELVTDGGGTLYLLTGR